MLGSFSFLFFSSLLFPMITCSQSRIICVKVGTIEGKQLKNIKLVIYPT